MAAYLDENDFLDFEFSDDLFDELLGNTSLILLSTLSVANLIFVAVDLDVDYEPNPKKYCADFSCNSSSGQSNENQLAVISRLVHLMLLLVEEEKFGTAFVEPTNLMIAKCS